MFHVKKKPMTLMAFPNTLLPSPPPLHKLYRLLLWENRGDNEGVEMTYRGYSGLLKYHSEGEKSGGRERAWAFFIFRTKKVPCPVRAGRGRRGRALQLECFRGRFKAMGHGVKG